MTLKTTLGIFHYRNLMLKGKALLIRTGILTLVGEKEKVIEKEKPKQKEKEEGKEKEKIQNHCQS